MFARDWHVVHLAGVPPTGTNAVMYLAVKPALSSCRPHCMRRIRQESRAQCIYICGSARAVPQQPRTHDGQIDVGQVPRPVIDSHLRLTATCDLQRHSGSHSTCYLTTAHTSWPAASAKGGMRQANFRTWSCRCLDIPVRLRGPLAVRRKNAIRRGLPFAADHGV